RFRRGPAQKQGATALTAFASRVVHAGVAIATTNERELLVTEPARLDAFLLRSCPALSRRVARRLIADGLVRVNGRVVPKGTRVFEGDRIALPALRLEPEPDLPIRVVHLDGRLIAVDKPGGMPSHALDPRQRGTLAGFLARPSSRTPR